MSERFERIYFLPDNLYATGAPVIIAAGALLKDTETGAILAQLKFRSISPKAIKALKVKVVMLDAFEKAFGEAITFEYLDLNVQRDAEFGQKKAIPIKNSSVRAFTAKVVEVAYLDNTVWASENAEWDQFPKSISLEEALGDPLLAKEYRLRYGQKAMFMPVKSAGTWVCACGAVNYIEETVCHACNSEATLLFSFDLEKMKDEIEAEAKAQAEAKAMAEEARKQKRQKNKQQLKKVLKKIIPVVLALAVVCGAIKLYTAVIRPENQYKTANKLFANGQYQEAEQLFREIGEYKDSPLKVEETHEAWLRAQYTAAKELFEAGEYEASEAAFLVLGDYADSKQQAETSRITREYLAADLIMQGGEYEEAAKAFEAIQGSKEAQERAKECWYLLAGEFVDAGKINQAISTLERIPLYKDASKIKKTLEQQVSYEKAVELLAAGQNTKAVDAFKAAGEYQNAKEQYLETMYLYCVDHRNDDDAIAKEYIEVLAKEGYKDSTTMAKAMLDWHAEITATKSFSIGTYNEVQISAKISGGAPGDQTKITFKVQTSWGDNLTYSPGTYGSGETATAAINNNGYNYLNTWTLNYNVTVYDGNNNVIGIFSGYPS